MSKRHTLGVSKWLPSTKDKITFKITLRPSTPNISKHLCICVYIIWIIVVEIVACIEHPSASVLWPRWPQHVHWPSLSAEKRNKHRCIWTWHTTQLTAPSLPLTAQRIRHLATLIWTAWHLINPMAAENRRQINQMATLVGNVTEVIFTKYVFFRGALG